MLKHASITAVPPFPGPAGSRTSRRLVTCAAAAALLLVATTAGAQNALVNPEFDESLRLLGWEESGSASIFSEWVLFADRNDAPDSGSARIVNQASEADLNLRGRSQCVNVVAGESYDIGGWLLVPSGQTPFGGAWVLGDWRTERGCGGTSTGLGLGSGPLVTVADDWIYRGSEGNVAPPDARAAMVDLVVKKFDAGGSFEAYFDGILLAPAPDPALAACAAAATLAGLRRRRGRSARSARCTETCRHGPGAE